MNPQLRVALRLHRAGDLAAAERIYLNVLSADADPIASHYLGLIRLAKSQIEEGLDLLRQSVARSPTQAEFHLNLGIALRKHYGPQDAIAYLERATTIAGAPRRAYLHLGEACVSLGQYHNALKALDVALTQPTDRAAAASLMSFALEHLERLQQAEEFAALAHELDPDDYEKRLRVAKLSARNNRFDNALNHFDVLISKSPTTEVMMGRAACLLACGRFDEVIAITKNALANTPEHAEWISLRGQGLYQAGFFHDAADCFESALTKSPSTSSLETHAAIAHLLTGNFTRGWELFERRDTWPQSIVSNQQLHRASPKTLPNGISRWDGAYGSAETVMVRGEQGVGDEIMFGTLLPEVARRCKKMCIQVDDRLVGLFARAFPDATIIEHGAPLESMQINAAVKMGSLGGLFRRSREAFRSFNGAYLRADPERVSDFRDRLGTTSEPICGLSWKTLSPESETSRNIQIEQLCAFINLPGFRYLSLQYGCNHQELSTLTSGLGSRLVTLPDIDLMEDLEGVAALIACCDIVVSVGNSVAHMAGALGKQTLALIPFVPGWRWGIEGDHCLWYETVKIFRQDAPGNWSTPLRSVKSALQRMERS